MKQAITELLQSASKVVFIAIALAVIVALFAGKITGEQFMMLASMAFTFYFAKPASKTEDGTFAGDGK